MDTALHLRAVDSGIETLARKGFSYMDLPSQATLERERLAG